MLLVYRDYVSKDTENADYFAVLSHETTDTAPKQQLILICKYILSAG
jgi:hypothetical protein